jgi:hypothetical protein
VVEISSAGAGPGAPASAGAGAGAPAGWLRRAAHAAIRARYLILTLWAVPWAVPVFPRGTIDSDWWVFEFGARALAGTDMSRVHITGGALHLYEWMPRLQIGPPALLVAVPLDWLPPVAGRILAATAMVLAGLAALALLERIGALAGVPKPRRQLFTLTGGLLFVPAWTVLAAAYMHLDDVMVLLLALVAVHEVLRGCWWTTALALGVATATKPWAVVFFALVLLLPRAKWAHVVLLAMAVAAAFWLPFIVAAPDTVQELGSVGTATTHDSTLNLLGFSFSPTGARFVQLGAMVVVAWLVVRAGRWPGLLFAVVAVRMITDWQTWLYYSTGLVLGALMWDVLRGRSRIPWLTIGAAALMLVESRISQAATAVPLHSGQHALAIARIVLLLPVVVALAWQPQWRPWRSSESITPRTPVSTTTGT